jgi:D-alanyl-D-alanine dipeptidase
MKKILRFFSVIILVGLSFSIMAAEPPTPQSLANSKQLIVVTANDWNSPQGLLYRYQRENAQQAWQQIGQATPVVVGKNGMGWGVQLQNYNLPGPAKKEGDNRTPTGIFSFGTAFGFAPTPVKDSKLTYTPLTATTVCVDDTSSPYYNQIINSANVPKNSWHSGEKMRTVPGYHWGLMVNYNTTTPVPGKGSCIFMHVWKGPTEGTAGCVAMTPENIKQIVAWLNPNKNPFIVVLPKNEYVKLEKLWRLP